jgi:hypothetical protein
MAAAGAILLAQGATLAEGAPRLKWEAAQVAWHQNCAFSSCHDHDASPHRFAVIRGSLRSMARGDVSLYAVYLDSEDDLPRLRRGLPASGGPSKGSFPESAWPDGCPCYEWLPIAPNGQVTVHVDEAHREGKNVVAIVNGEGEILATHHLWKTPDLALLR